MRWAVIAALVLGAGAAAAARSDGVSAEWLERIPAELPGAEALPKAVRVALAVELASRGTDYVPRTKQLRSDGTPLFSNRLLFEASPYLQQHAHNPVDWRPWGDAAFEAARRLGRPVLVSIGYSTCHWCHVMEEESFDDPELAALLNARYIAIKVDREARPDIDGVYMSAVQAMTGSGGWPLNVWLTPDRKPFYGGTYFPPADRAGRPGFPRVLRAISEQYQESPEHILEIADRLSRTIASSLEGASASETAISDAAVLREAARHYAARFDRTWGGLGSRTKFPALLPIRFLLRFHRRSGDSDALAMAILTLEKMAKGGLYDQVGGGFHRYATDRRWLIPHFEKMLYDNALLAATYVEAWQVTGREDFAQVTRETLDYLAREMTSPEGGFYSATDADSPNADGEPEEGLFFTWTPAEIEAALDAPAARAVIAYYGVSEKGDLDGRSILHTWRDPGEVARELEMTPSELGRVIGAARNRLYTLRLRRRPPGRDEKILVAWNGLTISAFARAAFSFDEARYRERAVAAADFVLRRMRKDGRLRRVFMDGRAQGPAFLEDYAFLIAGLLDLYEVDPNPRWLRESIALQAVLDRLYHDDEGGGYFQSAEDQERLIAREKPNRDGALPSGNSVTALNLLRLYHYTEREDYLGRVTLLFSAFHSLLEEGPTGLSEMLLALDYHLDQSVEIVIVKPERGDAASSLAKMLAPLRSKHLPSRVLSVVAQGPELDAQAELLPWLSGRVARTGAVTAYVCEDQVCGLPTSDPAVFEEQISVVKPLERGGTGEDPEARAR